MQIRQLLTAKNNRARCLKCREQIVKGEGCASVVNFGFKKGYICFRCTKGTIQDAIDRWERSMTDLKHKNHHSEEILKKLKLPYML